jgi:hypothetical protein
MSVKQENDENEQLKKKQPKDDTKVDRKLAIKIIANK